MNLLWTPGCTLELLEEMAVRQALQYCQGNKTAAASALGIAVRTLDNKLEIYAEKDRRMKAVESERAKQQKEFSERCKGVVPAVLDGRPKFVRQPAPEVRPLKAPEPVPAPGIEQKADEKAPEAVREHSDGATTGLCVEPPKETPKEPEMPLPKREEVQSVLPEQNPPRSKNRGRPSPYRTNEAPEPGVQGGEGGGK
jgi:hypothetical protein